jgi:NADH:ubiquinone oxidoreductase subunit E
MKSVLQNLLKNFSREEENIISLLQKTQEAFGYIPEDAVYWFSEVLDIPASRFFGIATFYAQFHLKPRGKNIITACRGTACHVKGSERLVSAIKKELNLTDEKNTTEDKKFTLEKVACLGTCGLAPVLLINKKVYGGMTPDKLSKAIKAIKETKG